MRPRWFVGASLAVAATLTAACSDHSNPIASMSRAQVNVADTIGRGSFPFVPNVHTAALPSVLLTMDISGFSDIGEVAGRVGHRLGRWQGSHGLHLVANPPGLSVLTTGTLNSRGDVAVTVGPDSTATFGQAAYFDWTGALHTLRPLSRFSPRCVMIAINDSREGIGTCQAGNQLLSTIWTPFGTPVPVEPGGGAPLTNATILSLSNSGQIFLYDSSLVGLVFTPNRQLRTLRPTFLFITGGLNDNGQVTGAILHGTSQAAAAWFSDSATQLGINGFGDVISDDSIVVGVSDATYGNAFGFVWTPHTGAQRLPGLEGGTALDKEEVIVFAPMFMNHKRQILGAVKKSDGTTVEVMWTLPATITRGASPTLAMAR